MIRITYLLLLFTCSLILSCVEEDHQDIIIDITTDTTLVDIHGLLEVNGNKIVDKNNAVSYTHLTLPTIYSV